jgi:hypothetical protein
MVGEGVTVAVGIAVRVASTKIAIWVDWTCAVPAQSGEGVTEGVTVCVGVKVLVAVGVLVIVGVCVTVGVSVGGTGVGVSVGGIACSVACSMLVAVGFRVLTLPPHPTTNKPRLNANNTIMANRRDTLRLLLPTISTRTQFRVYTSIARTKKRCQHKSNQAHMGSNRHGGGSILLFGY